MAYIKDIGLYQIDHLAIMGSLCHELGHLIGPGGTGDAKPSHFKECVATVFGLVRLKQLCPSINIEDEMDTQAVNYACAALASGRTAYLMTTLFSELKRFLKNYDLINLSPIETANFSYRMASAYHRKKKEIDLLQKIFLPIKTETERQDKNESSDNAVILNMCADIMLQDHGAISPLVIAAGKSLIEPFVNNRAYVLRKNFRAKTVDGIFHGKIRNTLLKKLETCEKLLPAQAPEKTVQNTARDMMILGKFDKEPDKLIDPVTYESSENRRFINKKLRAYTASHENKWFKIKQKLKSFYR